MVDYRTVQTFWEKHPRKWVPRFNAMHHGIVLSRDIAGILGVDYASVGCKKGHCVIVFTTNVFAGGELVEVPVAECFATLEEATEATEATEARRLGDTVGNDD